ncbi:MAG: hypothetical protein HQ592_08625 [Planctomycetes bacterium]|nr:hypothetical protein [Planctomycetota bacterium]
MRNEPANENGKLHRRTRPTATRRVWPLVCLLILVILAMVVLHIITGR